jgi:hypothetical protein
MTHVVMLVSSDLILVHWGGSHALSEAAHDLKSAASLAALTP